MEDKKQAILNYPSRNVMLISLLVIGTIAFYNWVLFMLPTLQTLVQDYCMLQQFGVWVLR